MSSAQVLIQIHAEVDERVRQIREQHADWPCMKGCDRCCRHLAAVPLVSAAEWDLLASGLAALPPAEQQAIRREVEELAAAPVRPVVCPLLERASGSCRVYAQRPVACRSYGFYADREGGLYCGEIEALEKAGQLCEVIWGNHDALESRLAACGDVRPLTEWFALGLPPGSPGVEATAAADA